MPPVASGSALTHDAPYPQPTSNDKKKRKLPACAPCRLRRVLCMPQPPPLSCPRCAEKGIVCTTTPVVRKKTVGRTGKRIEEAKAMFGNTQDPTLQPSPVWVPPRTVQRLTNHDSPSSSSLDSRLAVTELSGVLAAHLLDLYQHIPQSWLPLFPRGKVVQQFEAVGRRLDALDPQTEVLAHIIIALTSRLSSHPLIMASGPPAPPFEAVNLAASSLPDKDLRIFGRRREAVCESFRVNAVRLAWERGALVHASEASLASCFLLEMLEERHEFRSGVPYGSAYVSHLRTLLEGEDAGGQKIQNQSLGWSSLIMREALAAANSGGRTANFTAADDLLLCGEIPPSLEESLAESVANIDVRDSVTLFFRPMRPYTYHAARLARECADKLTGTFARRQPLDERYLAKFLNSLDALYSLLVILEQRIAFVLSPAATSAHALPAPFETERVFIMRSCIHTLQLAWASLSLPLFIELKRRIELVRPSSNTSAESRRLRERLEMLLGQVARTTVKGALLVARCVSYAPSLSFLTHLQQERLHVWVMILLETVVVEDGGEGITRKEKIEALRWMNDGLKMVGWSWSADLEVIDQIEQTLQLEELLHGNPAIENSQARPGYARPPQAQHPSPLPSSHIFGLSPPAGANPTDLVNHQQSLMDYSNFFDSSSTPDLNVGSNGNAMDVGVSTPFDFDELTKGLFGTPSEGGDGIKADEQDGWTNI